MEHSRESMRSNIWFLLDRGYSRREILEEMQIVYGDEYPSRSTVYRWVERFEDGWDTFEDSVRTGRPKSSRLKGNIELIEMIMDVVVDRCVTIRELEERVGIPKTTIHRIIREDLEMSRVVLRWVPKLLSEENKRERVKYSRELLAVWRGELTFLDRILTGDETWFHYHEPEAKFQSSQWKRKHEPVPMKSKSAPSAG